MKVNENYCNHEELEKINNLLYICKSCSLFGLIEETTATEEKIKLLTKPYNYNIKNEINIYEITKNSINYYINKSESITKNKNDIKSIKNLNLYINYRKKLVKHMYNLCSAINTTYESYYLSITLMDNVINDLENIINNYQLDVISTICFIISKKFNEKDRMRTESLKEYLTICHSPQKFIKPIDLVNAEIECLKILKYNLNVPTYLTILKYIFICGIIFVNEFNEKEIKKIYDECFKILNFCIEQNEIYILFNSVQVVFAIIYLVRRKYNLKKNISKYFNDLFDIKFSYIKDCIKVIDNLYYKDNTILGKNKFNQNLNDKNNQSIKMEHKLNYKSNDKKLIKRNSQKSDIKNIKSKIINFSPIIKEKRFNNSFIKKIDVGSDSYLPDFYKDNLEKINDENLNIKNIIVLKKNDFKTNKNLIKHQFFRSNKHRRKIYIINTKNCASFAFSSISNDNDVFIEK